MKQIKNIIITSTITFVCSVHAQVAIGKSSVTNASVSLEFANDQPRGLILPYVTDKTGITTEGSVIFDTTDHKVKYLRDGGNWVNLSEDDGTAVTIGTADLSIQGVNKTESSKAKTVIGANGANDTVSGILILSDTNKAMILPSVAGFISRDFMNPEAGMILYNPDSKIVCVYNGTVWSFWKP